MKQLNTQSSITASLILGWAGIFMFLILPLFVGAISSELTLSEGQVGYLASADLFGFFLGSFSSIWWARKVNWRSAALVAIILIIVANIFSMMMLQSISIFLILRIICGIGQGAAVSIYAAHVGDTDKPERYYGFFLVGQTILGTLGLFLLPLWIKNIGGSAIIYTQIGLGVVALIVTLIWLPTKGIDRGTVLRNFSFKKWKIPMIGLAGLLLFFIAQGGTWAYMERIGGSFNLSAKFIGLSLSLAMIGAFLGSSSATLLATRWGRRVPLLIVGIGQPLCLLLIFLNLGQWSFLTGIILFLFLWNFAIPYLMGILVAIDESGVSILAANPTFALGATIAPNIIAAFVIGGQFSSVAWVGGVAMLLSMSLFLSVLSYVKE